MLRVGNIVKFVYYLRILPCPSQSTAPKSRSSSLDWGFDTIALDEPNEVARNTVELKQYETSSTTTTLRYTTSSNYYRNNYRTTPNPVLIYTRGARPEAPTEQPATVVAAHQPRTYQQTYTQPPERFEEVLFPVHGAETANIQHLFDEKVLRTTVIEDSLDISEENDKKQAEILVSESFQPAVEEMDNQMQILIPEGVQSLTRKHNRFSSNLILVNIGSSNLSVVIMEVLVCTVVVTSFCIFSLLLFRGLGLRLCSSKKSVKESQLNMMQTKLDTLREAFVTSSSTGVENTAFSQEKC